MKPYEDAARLSEQITARCRAAGFALAGVASVERSAREPELRDWIARGRHGSMRWLAETADDRCAPDALLPGAQAAVMVADLYETRNPSRGATTDQPDAEAVGEQTVLGKVARYARGRNYHTLTKRRLRHLCDELRDEHPGARFRVFADTAPVPERELAARAGLGWIAKNTLVINPRLGSWFVLAGFLTTLPLKPPLQQSAITDHCGTCTRCIDACPTNAITPYAVDASRCVSYLTIERRLPIDRSLHQGVGDWIAGCDICQEVCPHNSPRTEPATEAPNPDYAPTRTGFDLLEVLGWDEQSRRARFAQSALKRISLVQMKRTAAIIAGNTLRDRARSPRTREALARRLESLAWSAGESPTVREAARAALMGVPESSDAPPASRSEKPG